MVLFLACLLLSTSVHAEAWWKVPRTEDDKFYYYVGVSEGKDGYEKLKDLSMSKAMGELIREHFGITTQISETSVEEMRKDSYSIVTRQSSAPLYLKGTTVLKVHEAELDRGVLRVYTQLRVNKKDLEEAIANQAKHGTDALATYGGNNDSQVDLKVKTAPQGAHISLTHLDRSYSVQGQGDALFYLPRGRYKMDVKLPGYVTQSQEVTVENPGGEVMVKLEQLYYDLTLRLDPRDAKVEMEGRATNERDFHLAAGKPVKFKVSHPDYYDDEIIYNKFDAEDVTREIRLQPKPSTLLFEVIPSGSSVTIDGVREYPQNGRVRVGPGKHVVEFSHPGYFVETVEVKVEPNKSYAIQKVNLEYDDPKLPPSDKDIAYRFEYNPYVYTEKRGRFATVPFSVFVEMIYVSFGVGYSGTQDHRDSGEDEYGEVAEKKQTRVQDSWGAMRIHTKSVGSFKFYGTAVAGSRKIVTKESGPDYDLSTIQRKSFTGVGAGVRLYYKPKWSIHAEYLHMSLKDKETMRPEKQDRIQVGVAFEF